MRRREVNEEQQEILDGEKRKNSADSKKFASMKTIWIKAILALIFVIAVGVYIYLFLWTKKLPFEMSPEMEALYKEHGEGEAKQRRRPPLEGDDSARVDNGVEIKNVPKPPPEDIKRINVNSNSIHIAIVACGNRAPEAITSLKSFAIFSKRDLHFHIFTENQLAEQFNKDINSWPKFKNENLKVDIHSIQFPGGGSFDEWKSLFKPCASQRLFLPLILKDVDALIYVDTDVLFLRPPEDLWQMFENFNKTQLAGLAPEAEVDAIGWYNRFAMHPYYGRLGVNSGVMLMNLTRMRKANWNNDILPIYKDYQSKITWGDQDILNIMFHFKPEQLYIFPCEWNYRPDHCMYGNNCETALQRGISVVHGSRQVFQNSKQPEFKAIYEVFRDYNFERDAKSELKGKIDKKLENFKSTYCGETRHLFTEIL